MHRDVFLTARVSESGPGEPCMQSRLPWGPDSLTLAVKGLLDPPASIMDSRYNPLVVDGARCGGTPADGAALRWLKSSQSTLKPEWRGVACTRFERRRRSSQLPEVARGSRPRGDLRRDQLHVRSIVSRVHRVDPGCRTSRRTWGSVVGERCQAGPGLRTHPGPVTV